MPNRAAARMALAVAAACLVPSAALSSGTPAGHKPGEPPHWTYDGDGGPAHWGDLDPSYAICRSGHLQSPIDIPAATLPVEHLAPLRFEYKASPLHVTDNGHTEMVTCASGGAIHVGAATYSLQQLHFHRPSEERLDGKSFAMVAHLVHKDETGALAVVAILFEPGAANPALAEILAHLPAHAGGEEAPAGLGFDAAGLLPAQRSYFTFKGSLTTPPCSEGVTWFVLRTPVTASQAQIDAFASHYPHNARPVQPLEGRPIHAGD